MKVLRLLFVLVIGLSGFIFVTANAEETLYFSLYIVALTMFGFVMSYIEVRAKNKINRIKHFPKKIVKLMLQRQYEQQGIRDITVFQRDEFANASEGGFDWDDTPEGGEFWIEVILKEKFELLNSQRN